MEVIGWALAILLGAFVAVTWTILILEMVGLPLGAAFAGLKRYFGRHRHAEPPVPTHVGPREPSSRH